MTKKKGNNQKKNDNINTLETAGEYIENPGFEDTELNNYNGDRETGKFLKSEVDALRKASNFKVVVPSSSDSKKRNMIKKVDDQGNFLFSPSGLSGNSNSQNKALIQKTTERTDDDEIKDPEGFWNQLGVVAKLSIPPIVATFFFMVV